MSTFPLSTYLVFVVIKKKLLLTRPSLFPVGFDYWETLDTETFVFLCMAARRLFSRGRQKYSWKEGKNQLFA